ncbi:heavy metal-binding domain-containing protein [Streptomyces sp. BHT-5-2]|uniref:heavy metal-binding domain-containing protein n=1 Tax=unclassified Streptomyces TaxID=2593676 RepID=UPI001C8F1706|nr:heavy metal-binding domain-containing protein [Streptomyces sp. BHT-5-2]QZL04895.1 heavy metal-binding domain-containing protein [Streptomyces sp. BHT-5-2]
MSGEWLGDGLPPVAAARTAEARRSGTWTSALSTGEFAAIRSVGFEPVGQVLGSAVYHVAGGGTRWRYYDCGYRHATWSGSNHEPAPVAVSGQGAASKALVDVLLAARHAALARMTAECTALGGDGVVAADLTMAPFPSAPHCFEFQVIGTAVRAQGQARPQRPFTTHLDGQGFAKLIAAGWVPVELLVGLAIGTRHDDWTTRRQKWFAAGNQEVTGWSQLVAATRHDARARIGEQAWSTGADGVVLGDSRLRIWQEACTRARRRNNDSDQKDHVAEATLIGTAVAGFTVRQAPPRTLTMMSLDPQRRRARPV